MFLNLKERLFKVNRKVYTPIFIENDLSLFKENRGVQDFVYKWNIDFPVDKWYREKYNIRFNSKEHRETSFRDMIFEFMEVTSYRGLLSQEYNPKTGEFIKEKEIVNEPTTMEDFLKEARSIDLSQFNLD